MKEAGPRLNIQQMMNDVSIRGQSLLSLLKSIAIALVLIVIVVAVGLRQATPRYNTPATYWVRLETNVPGEYRVDVQASQVLSFPVSSNRETVLNIPRLPRECCWDLFGLTLVDGSPNTRRLIWILRDGVVIRRVSVAELERLPVDADGAIRLKP